jgi:hypothetical protein
MMVFYCNKINAQIWNGSTTSTTTSDNVTIGSTTGATDAKLNIYGGYGISSCTYTGTNALKIKWTVPSAVGGAGCMSGIAGNVPDAIHVYSPGFAWNGFTPQTMLKLNGYGFFSLGGDPFSYYTNTIYGKTYFDDNVQMHNKVRINTGTIAIADWNNTNFPYSFSVDNGNSRFIGKVQIGNLKPMTTYTNYALAVEGNIVCQKTIVQTGDWADYVFSPNYNLMPLNQLSNYININKHLPAMPNAETIIAQGQDVGELQKMQQAKIEELTLYILQLKKDLDVVKGLITK